MSLVQIAGSSPKPVVSLKITMYLLCLNDVLVPSNDKSAKKIGDNVFGTWQVMDLQLDRQNTLM